VWFVAFGQGWPGAAKVAQMSIGAEVRDHKPGEGLFEQSRATFPYEAIPYALSTTDALIILLVSLFGGFFYHWATRTPIPDLTAYFALGLIASFIHIVRLGGRGYYDFEQAAKPGLEIAEVLICWVTTAFLLAFFAFLFKIGISFSRGSFLVFMATAPIGLLVGRKLEKHYLRSAVARGAIGRRNSVLLGERTEIASLENWDLLTLFGTGEVNRFVLAPATDLVPDQSNDIKTLDAVADFVRKNNSSEILLALPWHDTARIEFIRERSKLLPISVRLLPDTQIRTLTNYAASAGQRQLSIEIQRAPLNTAERIVKRAIDLTLAFLALIFFVPIMVLTALAIKLDSPGPVIFRQNRKGFNGKQFVMFKFRTMSVQENGEAVTQAMRNDPRVTAIGKLLRASSIDELPQLINVLRGEMSLIGPRPHALAHDNYFESVLSDYAFRHHVKPGMTGWAQVNGLRGATPTVDVISKRVKMDLWYINNWSLWLDLQIILKTFVEVLRKRNAY
jgi:undecaprenyl-phosphate galactose phosphotransferase/putative colanic acid biosynthesis UDP-glucose lipid carrier transferase